VEDSPHGVAAAVTAGLFVVATPHGLTSGLDFSQADIVAASLGDLTLFDVLAEAVGHQRSQMTGCQAYGSDADQ
jgi:beta-phosphoglucomutase-like phosphatase (HAD superfamily)